MDHAERYNPLAKGIKAVVVFYLRLSSRQPRTTPMA